MNQRLRVFPKRSFLENMQFLSFTERISLVEVVAPDSAATPVQNQNQKTDIRH
jgi:hypothetical protein